MQNATEQYETMCVAKNQSVITRVSTVHSRV